MATMKPRLLVTLEPEQAAVVRELAELQGRSQAAVVRELVAELLPVMARVAEVMRRASQVQVATRADMRRKVAEAEAVIVPGALKALAAFDELAAQIAEASRGRGRPPGAPAASRLQGAKWEKGHKSGTPDSVTRGSGKAKVGDGRRKTAVSGVKVGKRR